MRAQLTAAPVAWVWPAIEGGTDTPRGDTPLARLVRRAVWDLPQDARIVDVGCGQGATLRQLDAWGYTHAEGVDPAETACGRHFDGRLLPYLQGALDGYLSLGVWEHDPAGPEAFAREAARVLRSGGRLVVSVPLLNWLTLWRRPEGTGVFYQWAFTRREFCAMLRSHGFLIDWTSTYGEGYTLKHLASPAVRRRLRWVRRLPGLSSAVAHMLFVVATRQRRTRA